MPDAQIPDEEVVYRRIPPVMPFFEEPDRVTPANFKLDHRVNELGLSVYRESIVTPDQVLAMEMAIPGSRITAARVGDIRKLQGGDGKWLQLDVIIANDDNDPGHAEIRSPQPGVLTNSAAKALRGLFKLL